MLKRRWTDVEKEFVRQNAATLTDQEIAKELSKISTIKVGLQSARKLRQSLGIKKKPGRGVCEVVNDKRETNGNDARTDEHSNDSEIVAKPTGEWG